MAAGDGLVSMKPTSIAHSGTSASINADGGVDFTAVTSLSLNGVFTSDYDNYLIVLSGSASGVAQISMRWRLSGTDATGSNYTRQSLGVSSTTVSGARSSSQTTTFINYWGSTLQNGDTIHVYGPALAQPTAYRSVTSSSAGNALMEEYAGTHSLSTAYDGVTIYPDANNITGTVHVFGYEE